MCFAKKNADISFFNISFALFVIHILLLFVWNLIQLHKHEGKTIILTNYVLQPTDCF